MNDDEPAGTRGTERLLGFLCGQVAALGRLRRSQRRLAKEDVCVPRELGELRARAGVSGIRKRAAVVRDPQTEGQLAVVLEPQRDDS